MMGRRNEANATMNRPCPSNDSDTHVLQERAEQTRSYTVNETAKQTDCTTDTGDTGDTADTNSRDSCIGEEGGWKHTVHRKIGIVA